MLAGWKVAAGAAAIAAAAAGWAWVERADGQAQRERATKAEAAAAAWKTTAEANAREAAWQRESAESAQWRAAALQTARGAVETRVVTIKREIAGVSDAYSPVGAALRLAARRLRELDATGPGAARPDPAGAPVGAAGDPAAPDPAGGRPADPGRPR